MEHTAQVMGIAGAGRGTGVTHFVIQAAIIFAAADRKRQLSYSGIHRKIWKK